MARPERNNVDYFPHSVEHGRKMFYLRSKYGNDGYAVWFMLLEELGKADFHYLDLKDDVQLMYLSSQFMVSEKVLLEIIHSLVKFGDFDKDLWDERIIYSQKFVDSVTDAYARRNNKIVNKHSLCTTLIKLKRLKTGFMRSEKPQRIEEDIKVKYKKWADASKHEKYKAFVGWLLNEDLDFALSLKEQITEKWFVKIYEAANYRNDIIKAKILAINARKGDPKEPKAFGSTLYNWVVR